MRNKYAGHNFSLDKRSQGLRRISHIQNILFCLPDATIDSMVISEVLVKLDEICQNVSIGNHTDSSSIWN